MKLKHLFILALIIITSLVSVMVVNAQEGPPTDDEVNAIAKKLYCPVCPNTPLDVCETQACKDWREQIRDELSAGWSEQQIIDYFVEQYGERVLGEPQRTGFTSMVWVLPVLIVLFGIGVVWQVLRSWRQRQNRNAGPVLSNPSGLQQISPELLAMVEKELQKNE